MYQNCKSLGGGGTGNEQGTNPINIKIVKQGRLGDSVKYSTLGFTSGHGEMKPYIRLHVQQGARLEFSLPLRLPTPSTRVPSRTLSPK